MCVDIACIGLGIQVCGKRLMWNGGKQLTIGLNVGKQLTLSPIVNCFPPFHITAHVICFFAGARHKTTLQHSVQE